MTNSVDSKHADDPVDPVDAVETASSSEMGSQNQDTASATPPPLTNQNPKKSPTAFINPRDNRRKKLIVSGLCCCLLVLVAAVLALLFTSDKRNADGSTSLLGLGLFSRNDATEAPSVEPSAAPTNMPSDSPSMAPSVFPSDMPSDMPSQSPSDSPSLTPSSSPSEAPSASPTTEYVDPHPKPRNPPRGYFNYDRGDNQYGPNAWNKVDTSGSFMKEFGPNGWGPFRGVRDANIVDNRCSSREEYKKSPRNLEATVPCDGHHEIRSWCGDHHIADGKMEAKILPHKLSLQMHRRNCGSVQTDKCNEDMPPLVDYPRYTSRFTDFADVLHYDIKVPAEHELEGETFDAEIQMLTLHPADGRIASIGLVVRAQAGAHNGDFQVILEAFQDTYDDHANECRSKQRERRTADIVPRDASSIGSNTTSDTTVQQRRRYLRVINDRQLGTWEDQDMIARQVNDNHDDPNAKFVRQIQRPYDGFDPFAKAIWPTIFFYRYDGTLTEPPCTPITWFVMQKPMIISLQQLEQIKKLLFTHRDGNCDYTSVHNADQSVARPVFRNNDQAVIENCLEGSFKADVDKGRLAGNKCRA